MFAALPLLLSLLAGPQPPGVVIDHELASTGRYIGSPSIVKLPDNRFVASHDFFGPASGQSASATTRIFKSSDAGRTWHQVGEVKEQFWSNLFVHKGFVYLLGTNYEYGRIVIRRSPAKGSKAAEDWSEPSYLTAETGYHTAPVPVVTLKGRLYRAFEFHPTGPWGRFEAFVISAKEGADLMSPASWTFTKRLPFPPEQTEGKTWLEGNAVVTPEGKLADVLRVDNIEKAAITYLQGDRLAFQKLVNFPGGAKKFTIRYDRKTKLYWTLSNPALPEYPESSKSPASVRNTLVLMSSPNLENWTVKKTLLSHPDPEKHAFQYVDWQFDGDDIVAVSRTAFDDEEGGAKRGHDANFMTFHRFENFRK